MASRVPAALMAALLISSTGAADVAMQRDLGNIVAVEGATASGGVLTGRLVNRSTADITEVRLEVLHQFLWTDERHPGPDDPSFTQTVVVRETIPAGGSVPFEATLAPQPPRTDGTFRTTVIPRGVTQQGQPGDATVR